MSVTIIQNEKEKQLAFRIRRTVFVDEQNVPEELEMDEYDDEAIHFLCFHKDEPIGASRLRFIEDAGKLERLCVLKQFRGKSYGKQLIEQMEKEIVNRGFQKAILNAQTHALSFYENLGYKVISEQFIDAGIPHVTMEKILTK